MQPAKNLDPLLNPSSIAIIGASCHPDKAGYIVLKNLIASGYKGQILPVNRAGGSLLGFKLITVLSDLPQGLDLAIICLPRDQVVTSLQELAKRALKGAVIMATGFKESDREGHLLEQKLASFAQKNNIALLGPGSLGFINTVRLLNATATEAQLPLGNAAFFSQSGALCLATLDWALGSNFGFSCFVHLGGKSIINEAHLLQTLADDPATQIIMGHAESIENGREFLRIAEKITPQKPVLMLKSGTTTAGARAVSEHTGSLAGTREAYEAAFAQTGIIQAPDISTLLRLGQAFSMQKPPKGSNIAIITNSGGPGILAADACENSQLQLVRPQKQTLKRLGESLPAHASLYNPIDIVGDADATRYKMALETVAEDEFIHSLLVILSPTAAAQIEETAQAAIDVHTRYKKPLFACFMGSKRIQTAQEMLRKANIPCFSFPQEAIEAIEALYKYRLWTKRAFPVDICFRRDKGKAKRSIKAARDLGLIELTEQRAMDFVSAYELPIPETVLARTSEQAVRAAKRIGYPVALKVSSPHIKEKKALGAVALNIKTPAELRTAFMEITSAVRRKRPETYITGCMVQSMAPTQSHAVSIQCSNDSQFGPCLRFGLKGLHTELLNDWSVRLAPLSVGDAEKMLREITAWPLLAGVRGEKSVNTRALEDILLTISQMLVDFPEIAEASFAPIMADHEKALVVDMQITLTPKK